MESRKRHKKPESYRVRSYRDKQQAAGLVHSRVQIKETDLHIQADRDVKRRTEEIVMQYRLQLEEHIIKFPQFYTSLVPLSKDFSAPPLVKEMYDAGRKAGVGPMAAVAGGIAEFVGKQLLKEGVEEIIVENGGDIFLQRHDRSRVSIYAGESPLSYRVGLEISPPMPWGICTSSGTVGHSLSMGKADSVTVVARSTLLADAAATRLGNEIGSSCDKKRLDEVLQLSRTLEDVVGVVIVCGEIMGAVGDVQLVKID